MIRSVGLASDVMVMRDVSSLEARDGYQVVRTPTEPNFWWGNFVIFDDCPADPSAQIAAFKTEFPDAAHMLIVWDDPEMTPGVGHAALERKGFFIDVADVLVLTGDLIRAALPEGIIIRPVRTDADWRAVIDLQTDIGLAEGHDPVAHRPYVENRFAAIRAQCEAGVSCWFGAWDGMVLAGDLGIMTDGRTARYRSVETRDIYRRNGICPALVCAAYDWAMARGPSAQTVIIAMANSAAGRIYRRCGFTHSETSVSAILKGY